MSMQRLGSSPLNRWNVVPLWSTLVLVIAGAIAFMLRHDLLLVALKTLPAIDLAQADPWLMDWRLTALNIDPGLCKKVLIRPQIEALPIADNPIGDGCGWTNSVRLTQAGGVHASFDKITCGAAAALTLWLEHGVQQAAQTILGQRVVAIKSLGAYTCRNIVGKIRQTDRRSEHAIANAIDIGAFVLADGRSVSVGAQWRSDSVESKFLKAAHDSACKYFHVVLGPDYNQAHHDHFHLDRGPFRRCA